MVRRTHITDYWAHQDSHRTWAMGPGLQSLNLRYVLLLSCDDLLGLFIIQYLSDILSSFLCGTEIAILVP